MGRINIGGGRKAGRSKGEILLNVLERVAEGVGDFTALLAAMVEAGYGASPRGLQYALDRVRADAAAAAREAEQERAQQRRYKKMLSSLKRDGLIEEEKKARGGILRLTRKGFLKLAALRKRKEKAMPPIWYEGGRSDIFTIVAFDVPERERRKRTWLREVLRNLGFECVQKSVWIGKVKVPRQFLRDVRRYHLAEFIEVFQITKRGTLQQIE